MREKRGRHAASTWVGGIAGAAALSALAWRYRGKKREELPQEEKLLKLAGNSQRYSPLNLRPMKNSPLRGRELLLLGSGPARGSGALDEGVGEYLAARLDARLIKLAVRGSALSYEGEGSYLPRLHALDRRTRPALLLVELPREEAGRPLGQVSPGADPRELDVESSLGAMEHIILYAREVLGCPVMFFTLSRMEAPGYDRLVEGAKALRKKWGVGLADLWSDPGFSRLSSQQRKLYLAAPGQPTRAGYTRWWGPRLEKALLRFMEEQGL